MSKNGFTFIAAPHAPFDSDGRVALDVIEQQAQWLHTSGVRGVYINGTTGEGLSLTHEERRDIAQRWVDVANGSLRVIVHVGHLSLPEACDLAAHAQAIGADAVSAIAPSFFKPASVNALVAYCAAIASKAPKLPFYYYHSPGMTLCTVAPDAFLERGSDEMPTLAGVKFNDPNLYLYQRCLGVQDGRFDNPFGVDEALLGGLACGATSAIGSTYNYAAPHYLRMVELYNAGQHDQAHRMAREVLDLIELLLTYGVVATGKALMKLRGIDVGAPRLPIEPLDDQTMQQLLEKGSQLEVMRSGNALVTHTVNQIPA